MPDELSTSRLRLIALSAAQLAKVLDDPAGLQTEMGFPVSRDLVDANVTRAIKLKLGKMTTAAPSLHSWYTYWLIVTKDTVIGVGLIGFKGEPDSRGATEIGYGIDAAYRNRGYMTEVVKMLREWAFRRPGCRVLTASAVFNPASEKVLQKTGWQKVRQAEKSSDWEYLNPAMQ